MPVTAAPAEMAKPPETLDHSGIAAYVPHQGSMCLLDRLHEWSADRIHCSAISHRAADNPLRGASGLPAPAAIEYAAQAMALHGGLMAESADPPQAGYIAAVRGVRFAVLNLHDVEGALQIHAQRLAGSASIVSYQFQIDDRDGNRLVEGRASVVLNPRVTSP